MAFIVMFNDHSLSLMKNKGRRYPTEKNDCPPKKPRNNKVSKKEAISAQVTSNVSSSFEVTAIIF